jgi:hypothetical protein
VNEKKFRTLIDSGSEVDVLDPSIVRALKLRTFKLSKPVSLHLADKTLYQTITEAALAPLRIGEHEEEHLFYITPLPELKIVLGDPWLQDHNPHVDWVEQSLYFNAACCFAKGCLSHARPYKAYAHDSPIRYAKRVSTEGPDICFISARLFFAIAKRRDHHSFLFMPRDQTTPAKHFCAATTGAVQPSDYDIFMKGKPSYTLEELKAKVPKAYHSVLRVFMKEAKELPPHRPEDHDIQLTSDAKLPFARNYKPLNIEE